MKKASHFAIFLWILAWITTGTLALDDFPESNLVRIANLGKNCTVYGQPGWKCGGASSDCIPLDWVCDFQTEQCHPGNSDEIIGCHLYPETGCNSWNAKKHMKCPHSHKCVPDLSECTHENLKNETNQACPESPTEEFWRCNDGLCITKVHVCDGFKNCQDGSDEEDGCNLFPSTGCASWLGQKHVKCSKNTTVCTMPEFQAACRACTDPEKWRCNSGWCIDKSLVGNGIPDCLDGSDERANSIKWWMILILVMTVSGAAVFSSFVVRVLMNKTNLLNCGFCQSTKSQTLKELMARSFMTRKRACNLPDEADSVCYGNSREDEVQKQVEHECYGLPMKLINILEKPTNWRKRSLINEYDQNGQRLYVDVHQDPVMYRNMYQYLVFRYASPDRLNRATDQLLNWEKDFHNNDFNEVVKCWRLHLGSSEVLKTVIDSVSQESGLWDVLYNRYLPVKLSIRKWRMESAPLPIRTCFSAVYKFYNLIFYAVVPFMGASALYFDIFKDISFAYLIYTSLYDMSGGDLLNQDYDFEAALLITLILAIISVQVLFMVLSALSSPEVFNLCDHNKETNPKRKLGITVASIMAGPLMPVIILANFIYYREQEYKYKRDLQCQGSIEYDLGNNDEEEAEQIAEEEQRDKDSDDKKVSLFYTIQKMRYRASLNRRFYSYYRVIQASIESFSVINILILIHLVCPRPGRKINLMRGVEAKIAEFLDLDSAEGQITEDATSFLQQLNLIRDVAFALSILYSFTMVITALARYVYQNKNSNMTFMGQAIFGLYIASHLVTRMTASLALFSTAEMPRLTKDLSQTEPIISLLPASIICFLFFLIQSAFIHGFKWLRIPEFRQAQIHDRLVHVLANTLVVIPFMTWDELKPSNDKKEAVIKIRRTLREKRKHSISDDQDLNVGNGKKMTIMGHKRSQSASANFGNHPLPTLRVSTVKLFEIPNLNQLHSRKNLRKEILKIWWDDPTHVVKLEDVKVKLKSKSRGFLEDEHLIEELFNDLNDKGFINKKLFNPRRTKMEYFWLLLVQLVLNLIAMVVEVANGGVKTRSGLYYSWDVRLASFFIGIFFLSLYYKRYHVLRNLTRVHLCGCGLLCPIFCCCKKDEPMQAIPDDEEMQHCLSEELEQSNVPMKEIQTQTSLTDEKRK